MEEMATIMPSLIAGYAGENRWYLEALGIAATKKELAIYNQWVRPDLKASSPASWDARAKNLAWRFHTPEAIEDLFAVITAQKPAIEEFRHLAMAFASFRSDADRRDRAAKLSELAKMDAFAGEDYQITIVSMSDNVVFSPKAVGTSRLLFTYSPFKSFKSRRRISSIVI